MQTQTQTNLNSGLSAWLPARLPTRLRAGLPTWFSGRLRARLRAWLCVDRQGRGRDVRVDSSVRASGSGSQTKLAFLYNPLNSDFQEKSSINRYGHCCNYGNKHVTPKQEQLLCSQHPAAVALACKTGTEEGTTGEPANRPTNNHFREAGE